MDETAAGQAPATGELVVEWDGGRYYRGGSPGGAQLVLDGAREVAPGPVDAVLIALAACTAMDVVEILEKRRTPPAALRVAIRFRRAERPPRRILAATLRFEVAAPTQAAHVERAVALSLEKYCSVASSLSSDIRLATEVVLTASDAEGASP